MTESCSKKKQCQSRLHTKLFRTIHEGFRAPFLHHPKVVEVECFLLVSNTRENAEITIAEILYVCEIC